MSAISLNAFGGMIPLRDENLLPNNFATRTQNVWLNSGALRGLNTPAVVHTTSAGAKYVYRIPLDLTHPEDYTGSTWMEFTDLDTDVIRSPITDDTYSRYYWTSPTTGPHYNSLSRIQTASTPLVLGVPAPTTFPTVVPAGGVSATTQTRVYVWTWVTQFGEEGPPSAPSVATTGKQDDAWGVTISPPTTAQALNRLITKARIYRTVTGSTGVATYFLVAEVDLSTTLYSDTLSDTIVSGNAQLQSTLWTPPPVNLKGFISLPNGIIAGYRENELWFCEPYRPHAWPATYSVNTEYPIVGLGVLNQSLLICTTGFPVLASGTHPSSITMSKAQVLEPCSSRASIIGTDDGIFYVSPNGLAVAANSRVNIATRPLVSKEGWQALLEITKLRAARLGAAYVAYETQTSGTSDGVMLDGSGLETSFNLLSEPAVTNVMTDIWTSDVLLLKGTSVSRMHPPGGAMQAYMWKSKPLNVGYKRNMGVLQVYFDEIDGFTQADTANDALEQTLADNQYGIIKLYADSVHVATREIRKSRALIRLPSGYKAEMYQVEVFARVAIKNIDIAPTIKDLRNV